MLTTLKWEKASYCESGRFAYMTAGYVNKLGKGKITVYNGTLRVARSFEVLHIHSHCEM